MEMILTVFFQDGLHFREDNDVKEYENLRVQRDIKTREYFYYNSFVIDRH